jgi:hypothetical protein
MKITLVQADEPSCKSNIMNIQVDKMQEDKSQSKDRADFQNKVSDECAFKIVDNRPEDSAQKRLQAIANNSLQVNQLRAFQEMANNSVQAKWNKPLQSPVNNYSNKQDSIGQRKINDGRGSQGQQLFADLPRPALQFKSGITLQDKQAASDTLLSKNHIPIQTKKLNSFTPFEPITFPRKKSRVVVQRQIGPGGNALRGSDVKRLDNGAIGEIIDVLSEGDMEGEEFKGQYTIRFADKTEIRVQYDDENYTLLVIPADGGEIVDDGGEVKPAVVGKEIKAPAVESEDTGAQLLEFSVKFMDLLDIGIRQESPGILQFHQYLMQLRLGLEPDPEPAPGSDGEPAPEPAPGAKPDAENPIYDALCNIFEAGDVGEIHDQLRQYVRSFTLFTTVDDIASAAILLPHAQSTYEQLKTLIGQSKVQKESKDSSGLGPFYETVRPAMEKANAAISRIKPSGGGGKGNKRRMVDLITAFQSKHGTNTDWPINAEYSNREFANCAVAFYECMVKLCTEFNQIPDKNRRQLGKVASVIQNWTTYNCHNKVMVALLKALQ